MNLIFSADRNWGIGKENGLLFRVPGDMAFFKQKTLGKTVVMGRATLDSLPGGKPLPGRDNIVLTRDETFAREGVAVCRSLKDLFGLLAVLRDEDVFIIGGEQIYRQLMPYCARAYITRWDAAAEADAFVPDFDTESGWQLAEQSEWVEEKGVRYRFCTYLQEHPRDREQ